MVGEKLRNLKNPAMCISTIKARDIEFETRTVLRIGAGTRTTGRSGVVEAFTHSIKLSGECGDLTSEISDGI